jgi:hypothetical protein
MIATSLSWEHCGRKFVQQSVILLYVAKDI